MNMRLSRHSSASRPIRQSSYVVRQARAVRRRLAVTPTDPGVTPDFLMWLNGQLDKQGKRTIKLES